MTGRLTQNWLQHKKNNILNKKCHKMDFLFTFAIETEKYE